MPLKSSGAPAEKSPFGVRFVMGDGDAEVICSVTDGALIELEKPNSLGDWLATFERHRVTVEALAIYKYRLGLQQAGGTVVVDVDDIKTFKGEGTNAPSMAG